MTWIQQESSKGLCPMCRQSRSPGPVDLTLMVLMLTTRRIRVEGKRGIMTKRLLDGGLRERRYRRDIMIPFCV